MYELIEFFEPVKIELWLIKVILLYIASYGIIWICALILCRLLGGERLVIRVYLGWLFSLSVHSIFFTFFLLTSAKHYKELGISLWFCIPYLIPIFLNGIIGLDILNKIKNSLKEEG